MVQVLTVSDIKKLVSTIGVKPFFKALVNEIEQDFLRWPDFDKSPRHAIHVENGVMELMPTADEAHYAFKFVNGHADNPMRNKLCVTGLGFLAEVETGYPLLISEMTLLTAFRTAATSALAAKYLAKKETKILGIIGTGAQSEFQVMAFASMFDIDAVKYFDIDPEAMQKFSRNLSGESFELIPCNDVESTIVDVDIITTATAVRKHAALLRPNLLHDGLHINSIGGDSPGKTELDPEILKAAKVVVEYIPQSMVEGEIQQVGGTDHVDSELWEIIASHKKGRTSPEEITLFDSVGFAIEDYAALRCIYRLAVQHNVGIQMDLLPEVSDPKDLYGVLDS